MKPILYFIVFLLVSCAQLKEKKLEPLQIADLNKNLNSFCSSHSGKGEASLKDETYQFFYESLFDTKANKWLMAVEIPLKGDEDLGITWHKNKYRYRGSFYSRLKNTFYRWSKSKQIKIKDFKKFLQMIVESQIIFEEFKQLPTKDRQKYFKICENKLNCSYEYKGFSIQHNITSYQILKKIKDFNYSMSLIKNSTKNHLSLFQIELKDSESKLFSLRLLPKECADK
jgi:hypothetical protein